MPEYQIGQCVAERQLELKLASSSEPVVVRIGTPYFVKEMDAWQCPYEIEMKGRKKVFAIYGEDSMQALALTLKVLDVELEVTAKQASGSILWFGEPHISVMEPADPKRGR